MNENHIKDKKMKKKGKNIKIDLLDTSNKKVNKNNKTFENNKTNEFINNVTLECFMNTSQYEKYIKKNNGNLQNNNKISNNNYNNDDYDEEILFYKDRILNLLEKMFNKEFPNDALKSIFNTLIKN